MRTALYLPSHLESRGAMASMVTAAATVSAPAAFSAAGSKASQGSQSGQIKAFVGLKSGGLFSGSNVDSEFASKTVKNGSRVHCMQTLNPYNNDKYETLSYLPPLSNDAIAKQIDYVLRSGWIPCIEFDNVGTISRVNNQSPGYYDGRYWVMWKLPMFGCQDSAQVLREIAECQKEFPKAFIRIIGFDNVRQVQCAAFLVHRPN